MNSFKLYTKVDTFSGEAAAEPMTDIACPDDDDDEFDLNFNNIIRYINRNDLVV